MQDPLVSAIITCYNEADYVGRAIESVLCQHYHDLELIVVNDGSFDNSRAVIERYTDDQRLEIVNQDNKGLPAARNVGVKRCSGEYVAFLDADDRWLSDKLERQLGYFETHPSVGMVYTNYWCVTPAGQKLELANPVQYNSCSSAYKRIFVNGGRILPSTVTVRRDCFDRVGLFDERLRMAQEREIWVRIAAEYPIALVDAPLVLRTKRDDSLASDKEAKFAYQNLVTEKLVAMYPSLASLKLKRQARLYHGLGTTRLRKGNRVAAREALLAALQRNPLLMEAYVTLGLALLPSAAGAPLIRSLTKLRQRVRAIRRTSGLSFRT